MPRPASTAMKNLPMSSSSDQLYAETTPPMHASVMVEGLFVVLLISMIAGLLVYQRGYFSWSWDAINHHVYLGYIAESPRWHLDLTAAASQSYQYPYLYWPAYRISLLDGHGATYATLWAGVQAALLAAPLWLLSYRLLPSGASSSVAVQRVERFAAVLVGMSSAPVLAAIGTTANDALAAVPVVWAAALGVGRPNQLRLPMLGAALLGVGVAFKLSNVIYLPMLLAFAWTSSFAATVRRCVLTGASMIAGFTLAYLPWGWQLWLHMGNPVYPYLQGVFRQ